MKASPLFNRSYSQLNPNQKLAVDTTEGPLMVIAGPGTGKTQVLTLRIANILKKHDISPDSILALTFTEAAAQEMRQRLISLIGQAGYLVHISTFHSFCQSVIMENPDHFIINQNTQPLSDLDRVKIIESILIDNDFKLVKPINAPFLYLKAIISSIRDLKREGVTPSDFKKVLQQQQQEIEKSSLSQSQQNRLLRDHQKNQDLLKIYRLYQRQLKKQGRFDFEDMINFVVDKFSTDSDLLLSYQEKINYILVDEYQDTNSSQNQLVFKLASYWQEKANLFVVGDPYQSIFRFQGASLENTKQFLSLFPQATLVNLNLNYRSTQTILDSAHHFLSVSQSSSSQIPLTHLSAQSNLRKKPLSLAQFSHSAFEDVFITQDIKKKISAGTNPRQIAVIARHNQDLLDLSQTFKSSNIPFTIQGGGDVLSTPLIKHLLLLLNVVQKSPHQSSSEELFTLLNLDFINLPAIEVFRFSKQASDSHQQLASFALSSTTKKFPQIKKLFLQLSAWQKKAANQPLLEFLQTLFQQSGILDHLLRQPDSIHQLNLLNTFFDQAKTMSYADTTLNLSAFLDNLQTLKKHSVKIPLQPLDLDSDTITLTTAHKAKGLEWQHVYLYRCIDKKWGNNPSYQLLKLPPQLLQFSSVEDPNQEEKRLFYVSLTRSKQSLTLTSASQYQSSTGTRPAIPSAFISSLPSRLIKKTKTTSIEANNKTIVQKLFMPPPSISKSSPQEKKYLKPIIDNFKLSVTALNTYLECPYKFKLNNLYRIPRTKDVHLAFGTAVHQALEEFYLHYQKTEKIPSKKDLLESFEQALQKEILSPQDHKDRLSYGKQILTHYYRFHQPNLSLPLKVESKFGYSAYSKCYLDDIPLLGKVDRIDLLSPKKVHLVDYKTGSPKTKGQIAGTTKDSTGSLKRQLVFYKLLSQLDKRFPHTVSSVELDFVEAPYKKQKTGKFSFEVSPQEVSQLKKTIKDSFNQIRRFSFPRTQEYSHCHRCQFKDHCWPQGTPQNHPEKQSKSKR